MIAVYVLYSDSFERYYTGMTDDLLRRLKEHNAGKTKSTKAYKPWRLVYKEELENRTDARVREKYLKSGVGREYIKNVRARSSAGYQPAGRQGAHY